MTEKTLLVNPTPEVWSAHLDQIASRDRRDRDGGRLQKIPGRRA